MSSPTQTEYTAIKSTVSSIQALQLALDVELRQFLHGHSMTPNDTSLWTNQFIDYLLDKNAEYRTRLTEKISRQARRLRRLIAPSIFNSKVEAMLQIVAEVAVEIAEIEQLFRHQHGSMTVVQRSFFNDLLTTVRQSYEACTTETLALRLRFEELRPALDFLGQPEDVLFRMLVLGPYSTRDAIRASIGGAMDDLATLHISREGIGRRATEIEYNVSIDWCGAGVTHPQLQEATETLNDLHAQISSQIRSQNVALLKLQAEAATANSSPHRLQEHRDAQWSLPDLITVATDYDSLSRYCSLLEEEQIRVSVRQANLRLSQGRSAPARN
ncbi:hypothetical protein GY45DRAFT_1375557 [Cubamyces sp. BRFM 1775]|nr:hypothetical protein GY45DRAFT_1375557 [Cubamyces sp. BRFM 1775]